MPYKAGHGPQQLKAKYKATVTKMAGPKAESAMAKILSIGMTGAKELTPMEYGNLMNSAFRRVERHPTEVVGLMGYTGGMTAKGFNYGYHLHETTNWKPRPVGMKDGPAWNPRATPKFLERGLTDPDQKALIMRALRSEYK